MIHVVDAMMGSGKSSAAINMVNRSPKGTKFIYVVPLLSETKRIVEFCKLKKFEEPEAKYNKESDVANKSEGLKRLLRKGKNIATTHALFHMLDDEMLEIIKSKEYILVLDEVTDVVSHYDLKKADLETLLEKYADMDDKGILTWREKQAGYDGDKWMEEHKLCLSGCIAANNDSSVVWLFPLKIFDAFKESYILTYMFNGQLQKYYYDYMGLEYDYMYVKGSTLKDYTLTTKPQPAVKPSSLKGLINICENRKMNAVGDDYYALSKKWYAGFFALDDVANTKLCNGVHNFFKNITVSTLNESLWTTFKFYYDDIYKHAFKDSFIPCTYKATNEYRKRSNLAYLVNIFMDPVVMKFFIGHGVAVEPDIYALSSMIQWIWRSAIRDGSQINIYVPSSRMRQLLKDWLDDKYEVEI